ncbi:MAG: hypothetical protein PGN09_12215 [Sphingomonas fennica]
MILFAAALLAATAVPGDAAHRADRLRTEALNHSAAAAVARRDAANATVRARGRADRADYERRLSAWRRQVAACRAGDAEACAAR